MRRFGGRTVQVIAWTVIVAAVGALVVAVLVPRVSGATPYAVLTGSMEPDLPAGTLVVVKPSDDIALGDVITYQLRSGEGTVVTHRVVGQGVNAAGEASWTTQGDANDVPDAEPVRDVQIRGEVWYSVPYLGHAHTVLSGDQRRTLVLVVVAGLLLYATAMFTGALRDRRRRQLTESRS